MTPEGKVKKSVATLLTSYGIREAKDAGKQGDAEGWFFMASTSGRGVKGVPDIIGHYKGHFFGAEIKAPGKKPDGFQALQLEAIYKSGGAVFVIDGDLTELTDWLEALCA
jgi:hypothetical protein